MPTSPMRLDTDPDGRLRLGEQLYLVSLPRRTRRNITKRMGRTVIKDAKANIRQQRTIYGRPMVDRKDARVRRKMLRGMGKGLKPFMRGSDRVDVTWGKSLTAQIADRHQNGVPSEWTPDKAAEVYGTPKYKDPATRTQAKALKAEGFRLPVKKKRGKGISLKRVPLKWIMDNMTIGQAGVILRMMRTKKDKGVQHWVVRPAARPFLGPKPGTEDKFLNELARQTMAAINR